MEYGGYEGYFLSFPFLFLGLFIFSAELIFSLHTLHTLLFYFYYIFIK